MSDEPSKFEWDKEVDQLGGAREDFNPDMHGDDMQESVQALLTKTKPYLAGTLSGNETDFLSDKDAKSWLNWYIDYSNGKRSDDDQKQIRKWKMFKATHGAELKRNPTARRLLSLRNWAIDGYKLIDDKRKRKELQTEVEEYKCRAETRHLEKQSSFDRTELEAIATFLNKELGAKLPVAMASNPELEQAILDFVEGQGGVNSAVMAAGVQGQKDVQKYLGQSPSGLPTTPVNET